MKELIEEGRKVGNAKLRFLSSAIVTSGAPSHSPATDFYPTTRYRNTKRIVLMLNESDPTTLVIDCSRTKLKDSEMSIRKVGDWSPND